MKKLIIAIALLVATIGANAQYISFSTGNMEVCLWNSGLKKYTDCKAEYAPTKFDLYEHTIVHTTSQMQSTYFINSIKEKDGYHLLEITSDTGNNYFCAISEDKVIFANGEFMLKYEIKSILDEKD